MANDSLIVKMANNFELDPQTFQKTIKDTVMPKGCTNEQMASFLMVAHQYKLNPFTKEIYAFPKGKDGIENIVSIDGWLKLINEHPQFDGMEFQDHIVDAELSAITCQIYRKDRSKKHEVTEYMKECKRDSMPWNKWPNRMLRHKATIQCARYAFGFAGIIDEDEGDRIKDVTDTASSESELTAKFLSISDTPENVPENAEKALPEQEQALANT